MTRKHFEAIARAVRALPPEHRLAPALTLAAVCAEFNPRFDRARFLVACGVGP